MRARERAAAKAAGWLAPAVVLVALVVVVAVGVWALATDWRDER